MKAGLTSQPAIAVSNPANRSRPLRDAFEGGCRQNVEAALLGEEYMTLWMKTRIAGGAIIWIGVAAID